MALSLPLRQHADDLDRVGGLVKVNGGGMLELVIPLCDVAGSNYVGVYGVGEPGVAGDGVFFRNTSVGLAKSPTGLARRSSSASGRSSCIKGAGQATWVGAVPGAEFWSLDALASRRPRRGGPCVKEDGSGMTLGHTGEGHGPGDPFSDINQFTSRHGRGAHFLFCDGHVSYLTIRWTTRRTRPLSTRASSEVISGDF